MISKKEAKAQGLSRYYFFTVLGFTVHQIKLIPNARIRDYCLALLKGFCIVCMRTHDFLCQRHSATA